MPILAYSVNAARPDTWFKRQPVVRVGAREKALLGVINALLDRALEQPIDIAKNATPSERNISKKSFEIHGFFALAPEPCREMCRQIGSRTNRFSATIHQPR
jgi:hypothetical protein